MLGNLAIGYLCLVAVMSIITFAVYGIDKYQARNQGWRIPERLLHRLALWGGWPGALLGQRFFRHKTQKRDFQLAFWAIVSLNMALIIGAVWIGIRFGFG